MGASLYVGRALRLEPPGNDGGGLALTGSPIECENMSWTSIKELRGLAERHLGISSEDWPFYPDVELAEEFDLGDVRTRCSKLRAALARYSIEDLPDNYWLRYLARMLRDDRDFCAKAW